MCVVRWGEKGWERRRWGERWPIFGVLRCGLETDEECRGGKDFRMDEDEQTEGNKEKSTKRKRYARKRARAEAHNESGRRRSPPLHAIFSA